MRRPWRLEQEHIYNGRHYYSTPTYATHEAALLSAKRIINQRLSSESSPRFHLCIVNVALGFYEVVHNSLEKPLDTESES